MRSTITSSAWPRITPTRRLLAEGLAEIPGIEIDPATVETNIVWFDVRGRLGADEVAAALKEQGVLIGGYGQSRMRAVTHLDVDRAGIEMALDALRRERLMPGSAMLTILRWLRSEVPMREVTRLEWWTRTGAALGGVASIDD